MPVALLALSLIPVLAGSARLAELAGGPGLLPPRFDSSPVPLVLHLVSVIIFAWNLYQSLRRGAPAGNDPWDGQTLEWATTSPPPERNFDSLPPIRSERPFFDEKYGDLVDAARKT